MQSNILLLDMIQHKFIDVVLENEVPDNTSLVSNHSKSFKAHLLSANAERAFSTEDTPFPIPVVSQRTTQKSSDKIRSHCLSKFGVRGPQSFHQFWLPVKKKPVIF